MRSCAESPRSPPSTGLNNSITSTAAEQFHPAQCHNHITNAVNKFIPQKKEEFPKPLATASGGIGHGMQFDDDVPIVYYACQIFFSFLAMCCFASVASFQAKWHVGPCEW
ncbi:hypothetical protein AG1IA_05202 [Rhizoctonia solani AG-1 IA]|uniref:Uncharacterized protein n=1 Tax=Thanatephorus cucumeris (strain AG1-IA) TaxID=983506 RepID=L8WWP1_THACA|nr:hypothetical protein AG1IA_05202 [Rhizoctonia solani AG-1 IA]